MTPTIGRIVLFKSTDPDEMGNGAEEVPAIITRVWSDKCVNLQVMRDNEHPIAVTSCVLEDDQGGCSQTWRWPPRA